ncbi:MAG: hypothetical protein ABWY11_08745, partial [Umezawaea sp.]
LRAVLGEVGSRAGTADLRAAVATAVGDRGVELVAGLPGELVALVRVLAVCGSRLDFDHACALAGLRTTSRDAALEVLVGAGLVRGGARVELADAAVGDRVLAAMSPAGRADLHARAAELGHRAGCADEDVAGLLLRADPIGAPWVEGVLRRAADRARHRGRPDEAAAYLERALREPLDDGDRVRLRVDLAVAQPASASIVGARHLSWVLAGPPVRGAEESVVRAADLLLVGGHVEPVQHHLAAVLSAAEPGRGAKSADLVALYLLADAEHQDDSTCLTAPDVPRLPALADEPVEPAFAGVVAARCAARGKDLPRARRLARVAVRSTAPLAIRIAAARVLSVTDNGDEALTAADLVVADARRRGTAPVHAAALAFRAELVLGSGDTAGARRDLDAALRRLPRDDWHPTLLPGVVATTVLLHLERGEVARAHRALDAVITRRAPASGAALVAWCRLLYARGRVRLAVGDPTGALADLLECGRHLGARRQLNPALLPWRWAAGLAPRGGGDAAGAGRRLAAERGQGAAGGGGPAPDVVDRRAGGTSAGGRGDDNG